MGTREGRDKGSGVDPSLSDRHVSTSPSRKRLGLVIGIAVVVALVDQLTKWWALNALEDDDIHVVWTLRMRLTRNTGASFSLGGDFGPWIALVAIVVVAVLLWHGRTVASRLASVALGLVVGGALGNLIDRVMRGDGFFNGAVVDFIDFQWWPVFNVADMGIVIGGVLLVLNTLIPANEQGFLDDHDRDHDDA